MGLVAIPRSEFAPFVDVAGVIPMGGVPDDDQRADDKRERDCALDREAHSVAGFRRRRPALRLQYRP
ncbi:MAG: hypothetical protein M0008_07435 [Actinomycetota bacterium]|nr:hypothetical protein [Actinomycetota bacterium]